MGNFTRNNPQTLGNVSVKYDKLAIRHSRQGPYPNHQENITKYLSAITQYLYEETL